MAALVSPPSWAVTRARVGATKAGFLPSARRVLGVAPPTNAPHGLITKPTSPTVPSPRAHAPTCGSRAAAAASAPPWSAPLGLSPPRSPKARPKPKGRRRAATSVLGLVRATRVPPIKATRKARPRPGPPGVVFRPPTKARALAVTVPPATRRPRATPLARRRA